MVNPGLYEMAEQKDLIRLVLGLSAHKHREVCVDQVFHEDDGGYGRTGFWVNIYEDRARPTQQVIEDAISGLVSHPDNAIPLLNEAALDYGSFYSEHNGKNCRSCETRDKKTGLCHQIAVIGEENTRKALEKCRARKHGPY
jgi:hypothetical protein